MKAKKILKLLKIENEFALEFWTQEAKSKQVGENLKYMMNGRISTIREIQAFIKRLEN
tara:strand:+ start:57 stop:230 length:174 start_codon:yes stop_codon:yes gene_type:complete